MAASHRRQHGGVDQWQPDLLERVHRAEATLVFRRARNHHLLDPLDVGTVPVRRIVVMVMMSAAPGDAAIAGGAAAATATTTTSTTSTATHGATVRHTASHAVRLMVQKVMVGQEQRWRRPIRIVLIGFRLRRGGR